MSSESTERWFELSRQFPIGPKRGEPSPYAAIADSVAVGQVRMADWQGVDAVVVIVGVDDDDAQAHVNPATLERDVEDSAATVIETEVSPLHGPITVWPQATTMIPFAVLGATIASIPEPLLRVVTMGRSSECTEKGVRRGHTDPALGSGAALAIDDLFDAIELLHAAPGLHRPGAAESVAPLQIPLTVIIDVLGVAQPRAMSIRKGKEPLTPEEAQRLALATEIPVDTVLASVAPLPDDLHRELQEPRWRPHIRRRAVDDDEQSARTRLGYEAYQLAARQTGEGRELWQQRLEAVLADENG
ncbi:hypothetical protein [Nocardia salmonicida]|uniref:hypothetical protein n=1 Tax=Nocardia salmonicida TaxID=53431 RepID=UPI000A066C02|nr:hypothetical protein [Nocardia salmonicida]